MNVTLTIRRYQPDRREEPYYEDFDLDASPTDRVLDLLNHIKWHIDGTLAMRRSCQTGICGSDAMRINGVNRLACKTLIRDVGEEVTIEPLMGYRVIKDLVVDMEPFFDQYRRVRPRSFRFPACRGRQPREDDMSNGSTTWSIRLLSSRTSGQTTGAWRLFATRGEAIEFGAARLRDATGYESDLEVVDVPPGSHARVLDRNGQYRVEIREER